MSYSTVTYATGHNVHDQTPWRPWDTPHLSPWDFSDGRLHGTDTPYSTTKWAMGHNPMGGTPSGRAPHPGGVLLSWRVPSFVFMTSCAPRLEPWGTYTGAWHGIRTMVNRGVPHGATRGKPRSVKWTCGIIRGLPHGTCHGNLSWVVPWFTESSPDDDIMARAMNNTCNIKIKYILLQ